MSPCLMQMLLASVVLCVVSRTRAQPVDNNGKALVSPDDGSKQSSLEVLVLSPEEAERLELEKRANVFRYGKRAVFRYGKRAPSVFRYGKRSSPVLLDLDQERALLGADYNPAKRIFRYGKRSADVTDFWSDLHGDSSVADNAAKRVFRYGKRYAAEMEDASRINGADLNSSDSDLLVY